MIKEIPLQRPHTPLLDRVELPADLRELDESDLPQLATELREFLLYSVGQTGGHFGAGLGVVELTIALHYIYNTPADRVVWDVGHQSYPHKILTGRREHMHTMRQQGGLAGFPKRAESEYDSFGVGHSSTSISAALGMALAARDQGLPRKTVAVIGDGAMTAGMAFEALNHAAHCHANMLVVLNDNQMSISRNTGGLNTYFSKIWASPIYNSFRQGSKKVLEKIPQARDLAKQAEEQMKALVAPGMLFEELGFNYIGPIDGHDLDTLISTVRNMSMLEGPQLLHIMTRKGKGFQAAEDDPVGYHAITKIEPKTVDETPTVVGRKPPKYQDVFGKWLCDLAENDSKLVGITPAMGEGSGMVEFSRRFPDRYHDVAIAEQHALTLAAGMACDGMKPVVAIYSTFLQRAYDQLIHDIAIQNLDVTFGIDRAGLVGEDGPTHAGAFDLSFLRCVPNMIIAAGSDENDTRRLLSSAYHWPGPAAVRYPRGSAMGVQIDESLEPLPVGKGRMMREGSDVAILNFGALLPAAMVAGEDRDASVADMRWVKPLDEALVLKLAGSHKLLVTLEDNAAAGGAGAAVAELLAARRVQCELLIIGLPDRFLDQASQSQMRSAAGIDAAGILRQISERQVLMEGPRRVTKA